MIFMLTLHKDVKYLHISEFEIEGKHAHFISHC